MPPANLYTVVETVEYTVEADSEEQALQHFCESENPFREFSGIIEDRSVEEAERG